MGSLLKNHKIPTLVGSAALLLWTVEPLVVSELINIPIFEALTIVFSSCFILTAIRLVIIKKWKIILQQKWYVWVAGFIAICGSDFCYIFASHFAPIAHVDLIDYLWPCLLVIIVGFLPNEKVRVFPIIGALLGLLGVFQLCFAGQSILEGVYNSSHMLGYGIALFGICCWGGYSLFSKYNLQIPSDMMGIYCGIGALTSLVMHLCIETTVVPTCSEVSMAIMLGLAGPGLAYQLWDYGVKYGNISILSTGCYFARVCGLVLLVFFDKEPFSKELVIACILTFLGMLIGNIDKIDIKKYFEYLVSSWYYLSLRASELGSNLKNVRSKI